MKKAVILFSGGIDSTVMLALALNEGKICYPLSFNYGQMHKIELDAAARIAKHYNLETHVINLQLNWPEQSCLTCASEVPIGRSLEAIVESGINSTYVPARNTIFLAYATAVAEVINADEIHIGCNKNDSNNFPDCRPSYIKAYQDVLRYATKQAVEVKTPKLISPLINLEKREIVRLGVELKVPLELTWSCYNPISTTPCGLCDSCVIRNSAFYPETATAPAQEF